MSLSRKTKDRIRHNKFLRAVPGRKRRLRAVRTIDDYFRVIYSPQVFDATVFRPSPLLNLVRRGRP